MIRRRRRRSVGAANLLEKSSQAEGEASTPSKKRPRDPSLDLQHEQTKTETESPIETKVVHLHVQKRRRLIEAKKTRGGTKRTLAGVVVGQTTVKASRIGLSVAGGDEMVGDLDDAGLKLRAGLTHYTSLENFRDQEITNKFSGRFNPKEFHEGVIFDELMSIRNTEDGNEDGQEEQARPMPRFRPPEATVAAAVALQKSSLQGRFASATKRESEDEEQDDDAVPIADSVTAVAVDASKGGDLSDKCDPKRKPKKRKKKKKRRRARGRSKKKKKE